VRYLEQVETAHPTKAKLVETAGKLLKEFKSGEITTEMVLTKSNISKGSLYHHFEDLEELIETALLVRYAKWVDVNVSTMTEILLNAKTKEDILTGLEKVTHQSQHPNLSRERFFRAEVLAKSNSSERFARKLRELQKHLTNSLVDIIREAQERGFYSTSFSPKAIAVFIQAYTLGKIIDDLNDEQVDMEDYSRLINAIIKDVFISK